MIQKLIKKGKISEGSRVFKELWGRRITILCHNGTVYCFDTMCSHMGGPLGEQGSIQDIEDSAGNLHSCIVCPAHSRKFDLKTGKQVTTNLAGDLCTSAQEQRVHSVHDGGDGWWWVGMCEKKKEVASDKYNVLPSLLPETSGWEEEPKPWPFAEPPDVISSSQESSSSSAPLVPFAGGERFTAGMSSPARKKSRPSDLAHPPARHLGFVETQIPFRGSKPVDKPPPHKATAWSNRRNLLQPKIGNYFPPSAAQRPAAPQATAVPGRSAPLFFSTVQAPSLFSRQQAVDMDIS